VTSDDDEQVSTTFVLLNLYWGARFVNCATVHNDAGPTPAKVPQAISVFSQGAKPIGHFFFGLSVTMSLHIVSSQSSQRAISVFIPECDVPVIDRNVDLRQSPDKLIMVIAVLGCCARPNFAGTAMGTSEIGAVTGVFV